MSSNTDTFTVCPLPDQVANAMFSTSYSPWLIGDLFNYVCNNNLVLNGAVENECMETGNTASWSLSSTLGNLPVCGR